MTDQETREKYPNLVIRADFINQQDRPAQFAVVLLSVAAAHINTEVRE